MILLNELRDIYVCFRLMVTMMEVTRGTDVLSKTRYPFLYELFRYWSHDVGEIQTLILYWKMNKESRCVLWILPTVVEDDEMMVPKRRVSMLRRWWYYVVYSQNSVFRGREKEHEGEDFYADLCTSTISRKCTARCALRQEYFSLGQLYCKACYTPSPVQDLHTEKV